MTEPKYERWYDAATGEPHWLPSLDPVEPPSEAPAAIVPVHDATPEPIAAPGPSDAPYANREWRPPPRPPRNPPSRSVTDPPRLRILARTLRAILGDASDE